MLIRRNLHLEMVITVSILFTFFFAIGERRGRFFTNRSTKKREMILTKSSRLSKCLNNQNLFLFQKCNASFIKNIKDRDVSVISKIRSIISIPSSSTIFCLDDRNLTKSCNVSILKQNATKSVGQDLQNLTENVFDQKSSNLCVAISVTALLRFAIKNDLGFLDKYEMYSAEKILATFTLIVYPRSMAGLNLNPNKIEEEFQTNEIGLLLERLCNETYLMETGWQIIRKLDQDIKDQPEMSKCKYHEGKIMIKTKKLSIFSLLERKLPLYSSFDRNWRLSTPRPYHFLPPDGARPR